MSLPTLDFSALPPPLHNAPEIAHDPGGDLFPASRAAAASSLEKLLRNNLHKSRFVSRRLSDLEQASLRTKNPRARSVLRAILSCRSIRLILMRDEDHFSTIALPCRKHLCPLCAIGWAGHLRNDLGKRIAALPDGAIIRHLTLTVPSCSFDRLGETITRMYAAFRRWRFYGLRSSGPGYYRDVLGVCAKTEISAGQVPFKLHPHIHVLLHIRPGAFFDWRRGSDARHWWERISHDYLGERCVSSWISSPRDSRSAIIELAKYCGKGVVCGNLSIDALSALAIGLFGRRMVQSAGTLRISLHPERQALSTSLGTTATVLSKARDTWDYGDRALYAWSLFCTCGSLKDDPLFEDIRHFLSLYATRAMLRPYLLPEPPDKALGAGARPRVED